MLVEVLRARKESEISVRNGISKQLIRVMQLVVGFITNANLCSAGDDVLSWWTHCATWGDEGHSDIRFGIHNYDNCYGKACIIPQGIQVS